MQIDPYGYAGFLSLAKADENGIVADTADVVDEATVIFRKGVTP